MKEQVTKNLDNEIIKLTYGQLKKLFMEIQKKVVNLLRHL